MRDFKPKGSNTTAASVSGPQNAWSVSHTLASLIVCIAALSATSCGVLKEEAGTVAETPAAPVGAPEEIITPLGLPPVPIPAANKPTTDSIALGRKLYYDSKLSFDGSIACASCHSPLHGFTDGLPVSLGVTGQRGKRNAPTVLNAAYQPVQFWDGRAASLELQAAGPIANPIEMNQTHEACVGKLGADPDYKKLFTRTFGPGPVTLGKIEMALASFERTLISGNSPFDRYQFGGDKKALKADAIRGLALFKDPGKTNCVKCHTIESSYALFSDGKFHNLGVGMSAEGELTDAGRYDQTKVESDKGAFRTPTLRNVALTGPYMHDGSVKTLRRVVDFYTGGGNSNPQLDKDIKQLHLTGQERDDLVAFLEALTGDTPPNATPAANYEAGK